MSTIKNLTDARAEIDRLNAEAVSTQAAHNQAIQDLTSKLKEKSENYSKEVKRNDDLAVAMGDAVARADAFEDKFEAASTELSSLKIALSAIGISFGENQNAKAALHAHIEKVAGAKSQQVIAQMGGDSPLPVGVAKGEQPKPAEGDEQALEGRDRVRAVFAKQISKLQ